MPKMLYTTQWSSYQGKLVMAHIAVAERALGRRLPPGAQVHHIDGNGKNNQLSNLVICPNDAYHQLLHTRQKAYDACGDATKRKCSVCKEYDSIDNLFLAKKATHIEGQYWHRACMAKQRRDRYARRHA